MGRILASAGVMARMVKIEHSVFALPFAYTGAFLAADGWPGWTDFLLVTLAMVTMRSFAMLMNRILDLPFDSHNPRTRNRPLVSGELSTVAAWIWAGIFAILFVAACAAMNPLVLALSPVALVLGAGYSLAKRFTSLCHFWLGGVLGLAPIAGWLAVEPVFTLPAVLLGLGVLFWVAGFDILYALQDTDFDRSHGLHSIPAMHGVEASLLVSSLCHANTAMLFLLAGWAAGAGWV